MGLLKLHEAIAVILLSEEKRTANIASIAKKINDRNLYFQKSGNPVPVYQIIMRTKLSKGRYKWWFEYSEPGIIRLKQPSASCARHALSFFTAYIPTG